METLFKNNRRVFSGEILKRVRTYEPDKEILPGITSVATNGHTPGHNSHIIASGSSKVYVQADVTNVPFLFARNPGWHLVFDQDGKMAEATRRKVYDMLAAHGIQSAASAWLAKADAAPVPSQAEPGGAKCF